MGHRQRMWGALVAGVVGAVSTGRAQAPVVANLNAKISESLMGPRTERMVMSEDGDHIAIVAPKGSRQMVLLDGVEGPVFDEIPAYSLWGNYGAMGAIVLSPAGGRSAYVARRAGDMIAVVDGKEAVTLSTPATTKALATSFSVLAGWTFLFSKDGSRLAYASHADGGTGWVMVVDGVKSPVYRAFDLTQSVLNGRRLYYVAQTAADQKWHLVVDGKVGAAYDTIRSLKVTPDGGHYAFIIEKRSPTARPAAMVIDGVEGVTEREIPEFDQAPDGRVAYMAMRPQTTPGGNPPHLIVGALDIPWTTTFGYQIRGVNNPPQMHVAWSADGKRFACIQMNNPNPGVTLLINGKPGGPAYNSISAPTWSPDGTRLAYVGNSPSGNFPVIDGQELDGFNTVKEFQWSPDSKRYAFIGTNSTGIWMVLDGKQQPKALGFVDYALRFSPVGKHFVYGAQATVSNYQPVVDGVALPHILGNFATKGRFGPLFYLPVFYYTADGNHLAYVGAKADGTGKLGVFVDGVLQAGPVPSYFHPAWGPDGRHFAVVTSNGSGRGWSIMLDGKFSPAWEDMLILNAGSDRFESPQVFRFYVVKGTDVYRVTLDLGA